VEFLALYVTIQNTDRVDFHPQGGHVRQRISAGSILLLVMVMVMARGREPR